MISWVSTSAEKRPRRRPARRRGRKKTLARGGRRNNKQKSKINSVPRLLASLLVRDSSRGEKKRVAEEEGKRDSRRRRKEESQINTRIPRATSQVVSTLLSFLTLYIFILMADNKIKINETIERRGNLRGAALARKLLFSSAT